MTDDIDDAQKRTVLQNDDLGSRCVGLGTVDGAAVSIETPNLFSDEQIGVVGYSYEDHDDGEVVLKFGSDVRVGVTLESPDARELAERLEAAADEAEADLATDE